MLTFESQNSRDDQGIGYLRRNSCSKVDPAEIVPHEHTRRRMLWRRGTEILTLCSPRYCRKSRGQRRE